MKGDAMTLIKRSCLFVLTLTFAALPHAWSGESTDTDATEAPLTPEDIPARIAEAEVGEWVQYRRADGGRMRLTVTNKWENGGEVELVILNELIPAKKDKRVRRTEERIIVKNAVADLRNLTSEDRISRGQTLINGRRIQVIVVDFVEKGNVVRQSYFSDRIPVHGLVRGVTINGNKRTNTLTLMDYGFADDEE